MTTWFIVAGAIALVMAYAAGGVRRMPLTTALVYIVVGFLLGPEGFRLLDISARKHGAIIQSITEVVIVISIFSGALKLRVPPRDKRWLDPVRLAFLSMVIGVAAAVLAGRYALGLSFGGALLLGAILAPTDPVLASDVQVERAYTYNRLRFALTGEAGMNDGSALPLVLLGLALIGADPMGTPAWKWFFVHVVWALSSAVVIGALMGHYAGRYMLHLRLRHGEKLGTDNFLALGVMGLSFGVVDLVGGIGFVAVFAAGVAIRGLERRMNESPPDTIPIKVTDTSAEQEAATDPDHAAAFMLLRLQAFTGSLERIGEAVVVIVLGALLRKSMLVGGALLFAPLLFFVIRPVSVFLGLLGSGMTWAERGFAAWFGIRGMASVYYLAYIHEHGAPDALVRTIAEISVGVVAYSILLHGVSVTPLMNWFERRFDRD